MERPIEARGDFPTPMRTIKAQIWASTCSELHAKQCIIQLGLAHSSRPGTGFARKYTWCELCKEVAMRTRRPPPGSPLLLLTSGQILHTDTRCPRTEKVTVSFAGACIALILQDRKGSLSR